MSVQTPPRLLTLARQALLKYEALAISDVEKLPTEVFPALFKEAFTGRHTKIVTAMVAAWPFPCLPVGALMKTPDLETFQAMLAGVDMGLKREEPVGRGKLQVLDLRNKQHEFWSIWARAEDGGCPAKTLHKKQVVKVLPRYALRRRLKVMTEPCLRSRLDEEQACFLQWAEQRKGSINFCCRKLKIWALPAHDIIKILNIFRPEHIEEFELSTEWNALRLAQLAPCLGQMSNLRRLFLAPTCRNALKIDNRVADIEECVWKFISQFSEFNCLQHLRISGIYLLRGRMNQVFGCLMPFLETLSISHHQISQQDLNCLTWRPKLFKLKHLDMSGVVLLALDVVPLGVFLKTVAGTLQTLDLTGCKMKDPHLTVLIPALSTCSQLIKVSFYGNDFSMAILMGLLQHSANLSKMDEERYPAPRECCHKRGQYSIGRFVHLCAQLRSTLRSIREPKSISFATDTCPKCGGCSVCNLESITYCGCL
ncbi:PRAME family member 20-like [Acomys russatus]|uniref:PRAME family member 20-like n=1 Tax=Acomys russatus TaxID=60746 RepID=UPI0021E23C56|nr:PRAME family member 20-like [Acomys russatus]